MSRLVVLLEAQSVDTAPFHWQLEPGEPRLLTVGSNADWSIPAPALLAVAAKLYYDGQAFLAAATDAGATLDGRPLDGNFRTLHFPASLRLGKIDISLRASGGPEVKPAPIRKAVVECETKIMAFDELYDLERTAPSAGKPKIEPVRGREQPRRASTQPARGALRRSFQEASWPKKATLALLPLAIGLFGWKALHRPTMQRGSTPVADRVEAAAAPSAWLLPSVATAAPPVTITAFGTSTTSALPARGLGATLQRRAVDAFASGNFSRAAELYGRLASEHTGQPAYAVASHIAAQKARGGEQ